MVPSRQGAVRAAGTISRLLAGAIAGAFCLGCGGDEFSSGTGGQTGSGWQAGSGGQAGGGGQAASGGQAGGAGGSRLVFISSRKTKGDLTGPQGADAICNEVASSAGVPGKFVAWISSKDSNAASRLTSDGPWELSNGTRVADRKSELLSGFLQSPINFFEDGQPLSGTQQVWTGTRPGGTAATATCGKWTSTDSSLHGVVGEANSSKKPWTETSTPQDCDGERRLYCFQL